MTDTIGLRLILGVQHPVSMINSPEQDVEFIALAGEGESGAGWYLDESRPFFPQIASLKGGGSWIESPSDDGRTLQSTAVGNVTETINLIVAGSFTYRYAALAKLQRFADLARRFHSTFYQTLPVQLEWQAYGAPGPQWALVYDISFAVVRSHSDMGNTFEVTVTLEREPYWRGIPFGQPPTVWTQYKNGKTPGLDYDDTDLDLITADATDCIALSSHDNKHEFAGATGYDASVSPLSQNWVDIPAGDIAGDAPALVSIAGANDGGPSIADGPQDFYIARSTKPASWLIENGDSRPQFYSFNAADANILSGALTTTADANEGNIGNGSNTQRYYWLQAASTTTSYLEWGGTHYAIGRESMRGRFAAFVRGRTDATNPAGFALTAYQEDAVTAGGGADETILIDTYVPGPDDNTTKTFFIGTFQLPLNARSSVRGDGKGLDISDLDPANLNDLILRLYVAPGTSTQTTRVIDLVILPYDEAQIAIKRDVFVPGSSLELGNYYYDNTGYLARDIGDIAKHEGTNGISAPELLGTGITLLPKMNNRLYFLHTSTTTSSTNRGALDSTCGAVVNIVPRWVGVRDE